MSVGRCEGRCWYVGGNGNCERAGSRADGGATVDGAGLSPSEPHSESISSVGGAIDGRALLILLSDCAPDTGGTDELSPGRLLGGRFSLIAPSRRSARVRGIEPTNAQYGLYQSAYDNHYARRKLDELIFSCREKNRISLHDPWPANCSCGKGEPGAAAGCRAVTRDLTPHASAESLHRRGTPAFAPSIGRIQGRRVSARDRGAGRRAPPRFVRPSQQGRSSS